MGYKTAACDHSARIALVRRMRDCLIAAEGLKVEADRQGLVIAGLDPLIEGLKRADKRARVRDEG